MAEDTAFLKDATEDRVVRVYRVHHGGTVGSAIGGLICLVVLILILRIDAAVIRNSHRAKPIHVIVVVVPIVPICQYDQ